jgi:alkanesulfonate monooxygenase SsuD/methylene tetrahydromethanopterin reductase-like flavin-dependent oxidoreductase (luciferase family)
MDFHTRGVRSAEQVRFMQALWAKPGVTFKGKYQRADRRRHQSQAQVGQVPVWFGGHAEQTLKRVAKYGDGFMPNRWRRATRY